MTDRPGVDDDVWDDDDESFEDREPRGISPVVIAVAVVAVLGVVAILVATRNTDSQGNNQRSGRSTTTTATRGSAPGTAGGDTSTTASAPHWPSNVSFRPPVFGKTGDPPDPVTPNAKAGVYVWSDFDGWHLWIVEPKGKAAAKGTVSSNDAIAKAKSEVPNQGLVLTQKGRFTFDLSGVEARTAGVVFDPGFYSSTLVIDLGGPDLPIFLGANMDPAKLPLAVVKTTTG